ncbi:MAG: hypothetical protein AMXMBFR8_12110 [Nevskiales bacterium]
MQILVTGATGFIGRHLCERLVEQGFRVRAPVRLGSSQAVTLPPGVQQVPCTDLRSMCSAADWRTHLESIDRIVHLAGLAHVARGHEIAQSAYTEINETASRALSKAAAQSGVQRLILVSTVKVFGEQSCEKPFSPGDPPMPHDAYARSKLGAEQALLSETTGSPCEAVIVRPPLVYGRGVKGNFDRLVTLVRSGVPLPFGAIQNRRSLVSVGNLCDLIVRALEHPGAAGQILLPADEHAVSTPELLRMIASAMGTTIRLMPVPRSLLAGLGAALGKHLEISRLIGSLEVDGSETRRVLQWTPPFSTEDGLRRTLTGSC